MLDLNLLITNKTVQTIEMENLIHVLQLEERVGNLTNLAKCASTRHNKVKVFTNYAMKLCLIVA